jgi:hypothetical protein
LTITITIPDSTTEQGTGLILTEDLVQIADALPNFFDCKEAVPIGIQAARGLKDPFLRDRVKPIDKMIFKFLVQRLAPAGPDQPESYGRQNAITALVPEAADLFRELAVVVNVFNKESMVCLQGFRSEHLLLETKVALSILHTLQAGLLPKTHDAEQGETDGGRQHDEEPLKKTADLPGEIFHMAAVTKSPLCCFPSPSAAAGL